MCGIVGYIGTRDAKDILLNGLEKLEYRGYDSAGIFVTNQEKDSHLFKAEGHISALREKVDDSVKAYSGIGHTRWATHGEPSVRNAHPHQSKSKRFSIVHNGVIENYQEIKDAYLDDYELISETDTEIIVQLVEWFVETEDMTTLDAFKRAIVALEGSYAIALIDNENPDVIYAAKDKSPLLLGKGDGFTVICSDAIAMVKETDQFVELKDKEVAILTKDSITIEDFSGEEIERAFYTSDLDSDAIEKGEFPSYLAKEISEQPSVIRKIVQKYQDDKGNLVLSPDITDSILDSDRIYIVAAGTSYNAGLVGKNLIETLARIPVEVHISSEFAYHTPLISKKPFFLFLSQSGETADTRQALALVNEWEYPSLSLTNVPGSAMTREASFNLSLHAGPEISVPSTKSYTAHIAVLAILSEVIGLKNGSLKEAFLIDELETVADAMQRILDNTEAIEQLSTEVLSYSSHAFYLGRGLDYFVALEAAMKLKGISYIPTEGFPAGEMKHGTIALIEEGTPVIGLVTEEPVARRTRNNLQETKTRGAHVLTIAMEGLDQPDDNVVIPKVNPMLSPLVSVMPTQLLAYYCGLHRGNDVDKPRNLAKSVTV